MRQKTQQTNKQITKNRSKRVHINRQSGRWDKETVQQTERQCEQRINKQGNINTNYAAMNTRNKKNKKAQQTKKQCIPPSKANLLEL